MFNQEFLSFINRIEIDRSNPIVVHDTFNFVPAKPSSLTGDSVEVLFGETIFILIEAKLSLLFWRVEPLFDSHDSVPNVV